MITLENVMDDPHIFGDRRVLLEDASLRLPRGRYALLSSTPEIHPALLNILAGLRTPRHGFVRHSELVSWPIGRGGFIRGKLTGVQMTKFVCSLYGLDSVECLNFLADLMTSPEFLDKKIYEWPAYVRQEYTFTLALVPTFEFFIIDTAIPDEDTRFSRLWRSLFEDRLVGRGLIFSTYREEQLMDYCTKGLVYEQGRFWIDDDLEQCIRRYPVRRSRAEQSGLDGQDVSEPGDPSEEDGFF
jgi:capsular polysaccharide transport system ATP-binding protein